MSLSEEINESIKKNLPSLAAAELQKFITEADAIKREHKARGETLDKTNIELNTLGKEVLELRQYKQANQDLQTREAILAEEKRDMRVLQAETRATSAENSKIDIYNLISTLFRNAEFRKETLGHIVTSSKSFNYEGKPVSDHSFPQAVNGSEVTTQS